jgi:hypothetical protein
MLFADNTNIIISSPEIGCFENFIHDVLASLNKYIKDNKLTLHFDKTNFMKFCKNDKTCINLSIGYDDKMIEVEATKFLGLQIDTMP